MARKMKMVKKSRKRQQIEKKNIMMNLRIYLKKKYEFH